MMVDHPGRCVEQTCSCNTSVQKGCADDALKILLATAVDMHESLG